MILIPTISIPPDSEEWSNIYVNNIIDFFVVIKIIKYIIATEI
jgi:hypothetical protein